MMCFSDLKEHYNSMKTLPDALKYEEYGCEVIFKMMAFLMGLQGIPLEAH